MPERSDDHSQPQTWHHGLVADWWAEFNVDGPEIDYFGRFVEQGQPALDAGCGTGRLLVPWLVAGYDVDGADVSADMIERCRARARHEGFNPTLLVQPLHGLDPPRRYRTIVACGVFGIGSTRAEDEEALRRFHANLEPDGTLLLDNQVPYANARRWQQWTRDERTLLPEPWPEDELSGTCADGSRLTLRARALSVDPLDQAVTLEMRAERSRAGTVVATETYPILLRAYFRDELLLMFERAGFGEVVVRGGYEDERPTADHDFLVYVAKRG